MAEESLADENAGRLFLLPHESSHIPYHRVKDQFALC
jgi:hypothetical protein